MSRNFKVLCFKWNSPRKCIQGSSFWIWQFSSQIPFPNYLFWGKFVPKLQSALFQMKLSTQGYSRVLILNLAFFFLIFCLRNLFFGQILSQNSKVLCFKSKLFPKGIPYVRPYFFHATHYFMSLYFSWYR